MIDRWSHGTADDNMSEDMLVALQPVIRQHPWWHARAKLLLALLADSHVAPGAHVLDAGCGWGVTLEALERHGYQVDGLDISRRSLEMLDSGARRLIEADLVQPVPDRAGTYDAVIALDVIEHIDDDRAAVANLARLTKPEGVLIVSVPALPELFTEFDEVQGHRRRYVPATLKDAFSRSSLRMERVLWWGGWLVPILRLQRLRRRGRRGMPPTRIYAEYVKLPRWPLSAVFRAAFRIDHHRALRGALRRGTSLIAIARKP